MKKAVLLAVLIHLLVTFSIAEDQKTYKHASEYRAAILDENLRVSTGSDVTLAKTTTDAKLDRGGQGMNFLHTETGDYRVEAPVNKGRSFFASIS